MESAAAGRLRIDARRNRDRIVEVARDLVARRGLDVPVAAIARHAKVGVATVYRHFPTRQALLAAVFATRFADCAALLDEALADPDPWRGFRTAVEKVCAAQAADPGFGTALLATFGDAAELERQREHIMAGLAELTRRVKATGRLRADFEPDDLVLLLLANRGVAAAGPEAAPAASRRLVAYLLDSFQAGRADPLPPAASLDLCDLAGPADSPARPVSRA